MVPLMRLGRAPVEGLGPVVPAGFLDGHPAPVWWLGRTRFLRGAELWRVSEDAPQELISVYDGAGRGWRAPTRYVPPSPFVGPCALFHGTEYSADIDEDGRRVTLVAVGAVPDCLTSTRPMISEHVVAVAECDSVFERVLTCTWAGRRWRVLDRDATAAAPPDGERRRTRRGPCGGGGRAWRVRVVRSAGRARRRGWPRGGAHDSMTLEHGGGSRS